MSKEKFLKKLDEGNVYYIDWIKESLYNGKAYIVINEYGEIVKIYKKRNYAEKFILKVSTVIHFVKDTMEIICPWNGTKIIDISEDEILKLKGVII